MKLTLQDIAEWTGGVIEGDLPANYSELILTDVLLDTRQLADPGSLFVAIDGPRFDGHNFVENAFQSGAAAALIHHGNYEGGVYIRVDDTMGALHELARRWRAQFSIPVVGVTGSNGKTIVKDMMASILGRNHNIYRSPGSYNSQVGVPMSLLGITSEHDIAIIEAGISQVGEMELLEEIVRPTHGVITNIGLAHAAGLHDRETTALEKRKLFRRTEGAVVVPAGEKTLTADVFHVKHLFVGEDAVLDLAADSTSYMRIIDVESHADGFAFALSWPGKSGAASVRKVEVSLELPGRHNVQNAAMAAAMAAELGATDETIIEGLGA